MVSEFEDALKVIGFYASFDSWIVHRNRKNTQEVRTIVSDDCTSHHDLGMQLKLGGKSARDFLVKHKDKMHDWFFYKNDDFRSCRKCGYIENNKNKYNLCEPVKVKLRAKPKP